MWSLGREVLASEWAADLHREGKRERRIRLARKERRTSMRRSGAAASPQCAALPQSARSLPVLRSLHPPAPVPVSRGRDQG